MDGLSRSTRLSSLKTLETVRSPTIRMAAAKKNIIRRAICGLRKEPTRPCTSGENSLGVRIVSASLLKNVFGTIHKLDPRRLFFPISIRALLHCQDGKRRAKGMYQSSTSSELIRFQVLANHRVGVCYFLAFHFIWCYSNRKKISFGLHGHKLTFPCRG